MMATKQDTEGFRWHAKNPLRLLMVGKACLFGAVKDSWDWHGREELEAGEEI
jgi:hypothetical protein